MSYYPPAMGQLAPRRRPGSVTAAAAMLYVAAALAVLGGIVVFTVVGQVGRAVAQMHANADASYRTGAAAGAAIYGVLAIVVALLLVACAVFVLRGKQGFRITTFAAGGLLVLCVGCTGLSNLANGVSNGGGTAGTVNFGGSAINVGDIARAYPHWYYPTEAALEIIATLCLITAIILLAVPSASAFFKPPVALIVGPGLYADPSNPAMGYQPAFPAQYQYPQQQPYQQPFPQFPAPGGAPAQDGMVPGGTVAPLSDQPTQAESPTQDPWAAPKTDEFRNE